jgi:plastocyanin
MASKSTSIGVAVVAVILASAIGFFIYSNSTTGSVEVDVTLGAGSSYFTPANATVNLGDTVTFVVFNDDEAPHEFGIKAFNSSTGIIRPSVTGRMTFVANQAGDFPFYSPLNATQVEGERNFNGTLTVRK